MIHINLKDLYPMVHAKCTNEVKDSIEKIGLKNPIVVVKTTASKWNEEKPKYPFILDPPNIKEEFYQIRFGHNRVSAYKELGYSSIPCIVAGSIPEATLIGKEQAAWQKQKLGPL